MLLPSGIHVNVLGFPPLDKDSIPALATLVLCWLKGAPTKAPHQSIFVYLIALAYLVSPLLTSFDNSYELQNPKGSIPGFYPLDGVKYIYRNLLTLAPFYVGSRILYTPHGRMLLLRTMPAAMLVYSLPMIVELRLSPQFHTWVYGYFPSMFSQQMRSGGFRPVVFFPHGLALAFFTALSLIAALILVRTKARIFTMPAGAAAGYLGVLLVFCKSLGPLIYSVFLAPLILFTRPRFWVAICVPLTLLVCVYPVLRGNHLIPTEIIAKNAGRVETDRYFSYQTRVMNEEMLLAKANEKPMFGWGTWGRNRIYDPETGRDISVTDGGWVITLGVWGWFGYLALFTLFAAVTLQAFRAVDSRLTPDNVSLAGLTLLLTVCVVDQIPNAYPLSVTFLIAGAVGTAARSKLKQRGGHKGRAVKRIPSRTGDLEPAPEVLTT